MESEILKQIFTTSPKNRLNSRLRLRISGNLSNHLKESHPKVILILKLI